MQLVGRRKTIVSPDRAAFGDRLKQIRKSHGLTQTELGARMGISQRLVAYYETEGGSPSPELVVRFAEALEVNPDALLGTQKKKRSAADTASPENVRVWKRFRRIQELPESDRKTVLRMIDAFVEGASRKKRA